LAGPRKKKKNPKENFFSSILCLKKLIGKISLLEAALVAGHRLPEGNFFPPIGSPAF
jgi:hypothetical protein